MKEIPLAFGKRGQKIRGILHLPRNKPTVLIIMSHGWGGNRLGTWNSFFVRAAREFAKKGYAVFRFDFRGSGDSDGIFEKQTITSMLKDLDTATDHFSRNSEMKAKNIILIGHSQGGYVSLLKAAQDKRIRSLILWMGRISDLKEYWGSMWFEEMERKGYFHSFENKITSEYAEDSLKYKSLEAAKKIRIPVGMIYGESDSFIPPSEGMKLFTVLKGQKELKIIESLDHEFSGEENMKKVITVTLKWLGKWSGI
ncbi:MAG: alpha/beta fold hydrolase [Candidatus Aenigmarchaeota archaeon]|nr:alpha/beta fold hydrolase [Candidatus Aenigmarchaeota archaeon]